MNHEAEAARSILAAVATIDLAVEGVRQTLDDTVECVRDFAGSPMFVCTPEGDLARAGERRLDVVLALTSPVRPGEKLLLAGRLRHLGADVCPCCEGAREYVITDLDHIVMERDGVRTAIDVRDFRDPALELNSGYLRRSEHHINEVHGVHLREAIARRTTATIGEIVAAQVASMSPTGLDLQWVTDSGAHTVSVDFPEAARTIDELGECLRWTLHPDLC